MGWRVAYLLRSLSGPWSGIRGGSDPDLHPRNGLVSVVPDSADDYERDSFLVGGILPVHGLMGAFFTATSMIGFIAGAGIVVRNSIILVDFIELRLREGMALDAAVIDAGAVRFRPMMLTAAAVVVGAGVILFDPIFQGLAIALMAGEIASLALSRMTVPIVYFIVNRRRTLACPSNATSV